MAINNKPIFTGTAQISWAINALTGSSTQDLTTITEGTNGALSGVNGFLCFTSDATNGGYVQKIRFRPVGYSAAVTVATVARVWINNGSSVATATNNVIFDELTLPASTISLTSALPSYELPLNFALPAGYKIYVTLGTTQTTTTNAYAGWDISVVGGSYVAQS